MWMSAEGTSSTFFRNTRRFAPNKNLRLHKRYFIFTFLQFLPMNALFCVDLDHQGIDLFLFIRCNKLFCANLSLVKSEQRVKKKEGCAILLLMYYKSWKKTIFFFFFLLQTPVIVDGREDRVCLHPIKCGICNAIKCISKYFNLNCLLAGLMFVDGSVIYYHLRI